jgi:hypothetical protein
MKKIFAFILLAVIFFAGCTKDNVTNLNEKIIGKWITVDIDGQSVLTDEQALYNFVSSTKGYLTSTWAISKLNEGALWSEPVEVDVVIKGKKMTLTYSLDENTEAVEVFKFTSIDDERFEANHTITVKENGEEVISNEGVVHFTKVTDDFSEDILGTWECLEITGSQTHNDDNARLEFFSDGSYNYYRKNASDEWELVTDRILNEYFVNGNFLATRWQEAGQPIEYEYWEIQNIDGDHMKWMALRQLPDGLRYGQGVKWQKVE